MATLAEAIAKQTQANASDLDRALTRYNNNQSILASIGDAGKKSLGLLSFALAPLDYLGGIARSTLFTQLNALGANIDINRNDVQDDNNYFTNLRRAVLKNPFDINQRVAGFGDVGPLKFKEDDGLLERIGKATVAFSGDVLSDPTTYLSFGVAPVAKKIAANGVSVTTASAASKILGEEVAEQALERTAVEGAEKAAEELAVNSARKVAKDQALRKVASRSENIINMATADNVPLGKYIDDLLTTDRERLVGLVSDQIGDEATAIFRTQKRAPLRKYFDDLADETGIDDFRSLWQAQSDAVRGGLRITTPGGKTLKRLTEGGRSPIGDFISQQSAKLAATRPGLALTAGRQRELIKVAKVAGQDIASPGGLARAAQAENSLRTARAIAKAERKLAGNLSTEAKTILAAAQRTANEYAGQVDDLGRDQGQLFRDEVRRWYNEFDSDDAKTLLNDDIEVPATSIAEKEGDLSANAFRAARAMRDSMYSNYGRLKQELGEDFSEAGIVEGALRVPTKDGLDLQKTLFGTGTAKAGTGGYKARKAFIITDETTGQFRRYMTLEEANSAQRANFMQYLDEEVAAGRIAKDSPQYRNLSERINNMEWFDTDPFNVFARNINRMERQARRATAVNLFKKSGLLVEAEIDKAVKPGRVVKLARAEIERLEKEADDLTKRSVELTRLRPGAPSGETVQLAESLAAEAARVKGQFYNPPRPVGELSDQAREVAVSASTDEGNLNRSINRIQDEIDVLHQRAVENATDANKLRQAILEAGALEGEEQGDAWGALFDLVLEMKESQANRLAAKVGITEDVKELRNVVNQMREARKIQATAVLNLVGRAEPMVRLGTVTDKGGRLIQIENQFNNLWAPSTMAEALSRSYKLTNETKNVVEEALRTTTGVWKQMATFGRGPGFVFRNLGGWWNAFLVGANGKDFADGIRYAAAYEGALKDFRNAVKDLEPTDINEVADLLERSFAARMQDKSFAGFDNMYQAHLAMEQEGIFGGTLTAAALSVDPNTGIPKSVRAAEIARPRPQVFQPTPGTPETPFRRFRTGELSVGEAVKEARKLPKRELAKQAAKGAVTSSVNNPYMTIMRAFSEDSERFLRASSFSAGIRQYGADEAGQEMASMLVKASQFDYTDLSPFEQRVLKQISPFFIWTKNNVPFQFRNLFANPGKVNAILKLQENVKKQFEDEDQDMAEYMPQWLQEQLGFASVLQSGENQLAMGLNLPLTDLNRFFEVPVTESGRPDLTLNPLGLVSRVGRVALGGARDDAVGSASPFVKAPIEALTGVNLFTGAKFSQQTPGPAYTALSALPGIPDVYINPETGQRETSGYALNQVRNLLPPIGQLDRLLPFGQQGSAAERLRGNWVSQGLSFLPVTVSATLTESQYAGELRTRNLELEQRIREYERRNGLPEGSLREQYNEGQKMLSQKSRRRALAAALAP